MNQDDGSGLHPGFDITVAHPARVYDYWLGGKDNFEPDRKAAEEVIAVRPTIIRDIRENRAFLRRAVRFLAQAGIRQFLDLGTGLPTSPNIHEVAQAVAPQSRVVYVDNDPIVLAHARALLSSGPDGACAYLDADLRDTAAVLAEAERTLDFARPVAALFVGVLHLIPDSDDPAGLIAATMAVTVPGSYLALTQPASDIDADMVAAGASRYNAQVKTPQTRRSYEQTSRFFAGYDLLEPGVVQCHRWHPDPGAPGLDENVSAWAGVARKAGGAADDRER